MKGRMQAALCAVGIAFACSGHAQTITYHQDNNVHRIAVTTEHSPDRDDRYEDGYLRLPSGGHLNEDRVGEALLPRYTRLIAVHPGASVTLRVERSDPVVIENVSLYPAQPLALEGQPSSFQNPAAVYQTNVRSAGAQAVSRTPFGGSHLIQVNIEPYQYDPTVGRLQYWKSFTVEVVVEGSETSKSALTNFQKAQLQHLALNGAEFVANQSAQPRREFNIILTEARLTAAANRIVQRYQTRDVVFEVIPVDGKATSSEVKRMISQKFDEGGLNAVVFLGDEDIVPLHYWNGTPGDAYYTYLEGNDYYSDIAHGRIPASDMAEATFLIDKMEYYSGEQLQGLINKDVVLVAHKENYPGKYTANMERVRNGENTQELNFFTEYGGAGATSTDVVDAVSLGAGIVVYRGHGSNTSWSSWGRDGRSFGESHLEQLANHDSAMAVFLNITCNNGAIQSSYHSMAENQLLVRDSDGDFKGAVASLGSTVPSYTTVNHDFIENMFEYMQDGSDLELGNVVAFGNNKLVRDNGGSLPANVKMYILFGDPLLAPVIAPIN